ncbi:MAG: DUF2764 family protein [Waddliaceae bacterium]
MKSRKYYTLIASLPYLPRFDKAERLPISRERLHQRLTMLDPEDKKLVENAAEFIAWWRQPQGRTNAELVTIYHQGVHQVFESPLLKKLFEFPVNQRTILVALRRRVLGLPRSVPGQPWGAGNLVRPIELHWDHPTFKLGAIFPWIPQAQVYLKEGESLQLEYMLMNQQWEKLDRLLFANYFGFEVVIAYLLRWNLVQQWLSYNREEAKIRLQKLALEIIDEQEQS